MKFSHYVSSPKNGRKIPVYIRKHRKPVMP